ncbi:MAG: ABC transporter permease [Acidobacteria bacterium]|nr:ABC transporter permease [Acidobacteriota bacterium]MCA1650706.1 ABC transporter permease [Acidobacteriota bacterium]
MLSERFWRSRFNGDSGIVGSSLTVNGTSVTIIGVAGPRFGGMSIDRPAEIFLPMTLAHLLDGLPMAQGHLSVRVAVRLPERGDPGVAADRLSTLYAPLSPFGPGAPPPRLTLLPALHGISEARSQLENALVVVLGLVGVLLLIACANVGNLLLSRFASRQPEFAIRMAIGAGRRRVVQQLLVESLLISTLASALALFVAMNAGALLVHLIPSRTPLALDLALDARLIGFTAAIALLAALLAVAASAWRLARIDGAAVLRADTRTAAAGRRTLAHALIVAQVACSLLLLVGAGSMLRTLWNLTHLDPGFTAEGGFLVTVNAAGRVTDTARLPVYYESLRTRLARTPGVAAASLIQFPVMGDGATTGTVDVPGFIPVSDDDRWCRVFQVGPDFFTSAGMSVLRGRGIEPRDTASGERVAVVNESFARFYFSDADPVGQVLGKDMRIVGIVRDARVDKLRDPAARAIFVPYVQTRIRTAMTFVVRSAGGIALPDAVAAASAAIRDHDSALPFQVMTLPDQVMRTVSRERFLAALTATLSLLALVLACAGLYALVSYSVSERRSEIGIRVALGARRADVIRLVLRQPVLTTAAGIVVGLPGAYLVMRTMESLLFGIRPFDALTLGVSAAVLLGVGAAAALIPAHRAASTDPQDCLRCR